ncbi:NAD(P)-dependent alcohol dehydrogenase (plasmid) [Sphingomonas paeninsulae]|uniref:NAD(P)-dependent alcohol dehydrogenase n=1 Tax=Sphingomonas paeninsulae TaxID=2319844 RepID=A0A494THY7_SPHPE|nr:NAD(P)-dependent alcohol dehydrogenase [Sphingomonas paeninsulae]AYJ85411.1 NAD(P)-dependent alcohol dehydrogenase [Sphingomonas paeninsulae]
MTQAIGYAAQSADTLVAPFTFERRALRADDVAMDILYCGVCHSDLHQARNDWGNTMYPVVPGHEIIGRVTAIGSDVTSVKIGDVAAIGCMVDSCMECGDCHEDHEQYCAKGSTLTYNGKDRRDGSPTYGGYSDHIVARDHFVIKLPEGLDAERAAPLLCAGITTWSPLRRWNVGSGTRVAVAGLGGLGHMGVKLAVGLGADVTVLTSSPNKVEDALALGAHRVVLTSDPAAMKAAARSFDMVLDTIPVAHDVSPYLRLLATRGVHVIVGAIAMLPEIHSGMLLSGQKSLAGSGIGGIAETRELLEFCAEKNILPDTETIAMQDILHAYDRMERNDIKYRFVIDMASLAKEKA